MDILAAELAQQALDIYAQQLGPTYAEIMEKFVGEAALNTMHVADLQVEAQHEKANRALILDFVDGLKMPVREFGYKSNDVLKAQEGVVVTSDPRIARLAQSFMVWYPNEHSSKQNTDRFTPYYSPYFVVGRRAMEPKRKKRADTQLLLAAPDSSATTDRLIIIDTWASEADNAEDAMLKRLHRPYEKDTLEQMFNEKSEELEVRHSSPESFRAKLNRRGVGSRNWGYDNNHRAATTVNQGSRIRDLERGPAADVILVSPTSSDTECFVKQALPVGVATEALGQFDVPTYLNRLATAFGKTDMLRRLLVINTVSTPDPVDAYIDTDNQQATS